MTYITHLLDQDRVAAFEKSGLYFTVEVNEHEQYQARVKVYYQNHDWFIMDALVKISKEEMYNHDQLTDVILDYLNSSESNLLASGKWMQWVDKQATDE